MENQSKKMVQIVYDALDEKLGEDIEILKVDEISVIADYLVIANGRNQNQLNAMTDLVEEKMIEAGYKSKRIEGNKNSSWVLMDYGDVIVHVFSKEDRLFMIQSESGKMERRFREKNYKKIPCVRDKITLRVISLLHMEFFYCILFERAIKRFYMLCFCDISLEEAV